MAEVWKIVQLIRKGTDHCVIIAPPTWLLNRGWSKGGGGIHYLRFLLNPCGCKSPHITSQASLFLHCNAWPNFTRDIPWHFIMWLCITLPVQGFSYCMHFEVLLYLKPYFYSNWCFVSTFSIFDVSIIGPLGPSCTTNRGKGRAHNQLFDLFNPPQTVFSWPQIFSRGRTVMGTI